MILVEKEEFLKKIALAIINYDEEAALALAKEAIQLGIAPLEVIEKGLSAGMKEVGERFNNGEYFLPQVMIAAQAMTTSMDYLFTSIPTDKRPKPIGIFVIGVAEGDIHELGVKIIIPMLQMAGFDVHYIGPSCSTDKFIAEAEKVNADIIGISSLMTTTLPKQKILVNALVKKGLRSKYKVMIGGGPASPAWCEQCGADGYGRDAKAAVEMAKKLVEENKTV